MEGELKKQIGSLRDIYWFLKGMETCGDSAFKDNQLFHLAEVIDAMHHRLNGPF